MKKPIGILVISFFLTILSCQNKHIEEKPLNVLMLVVDDLRPELGCYGNELIHSPNIDKLASQGVVFLNNFCNIPVCGASRASIMTGLRPTRNRFLHYYSRADIEASEVKSMSLYLKENGYHTISNGKIFHDFDDCADSWNENWRPKTNTSWRDYQLAENINLELNGGGPPYEIAEVHDSTYHDGKLANKTITDLIRMKNSNKMFFIASGFVKPHLPFNAPKKYWDLYSENDFSPTEKSYYPSNAPEQAFHNSGELRSYGSIPEEGFISDSMSIRLQHGYYACISYIDTQIGKILHTLDSLGLSDNTLVVLWGDHGWNLGEHGMWCKHCNFNTSLQAPLIIRSPGNTTGMQTKNLTEFIDIYPTICDLTGLPIPEHTEGNSLKPLLDDPNAEWDNYVICKWFDGLTVKTPEYAYTEWRNNRDSLISSMLYNHVNDLEETNNLADDTSFRVVIDELQQIMITNRGKDYFKESKETSKTLDH